MIARRLLSTTRLRLQHPILLRRLAPVLSSTFSSRTPLAYRTMATAATTTTPWVAPTIPFDPVKAPSPFITAPGNALDHLLPGYELVPATDDHPAYAIYTKEIERSPNDDRLYRLILLPNGMEALLIQDATTDKSSASMNVQAGHLDDPEDLQGLAHFCEHLMFMGTEKYPKENDYTEFLTQNSGSSNAFTGMDQTCYYFDIHPTALSGALDRFAQFFIAPVFDPSCTEREANAVHSENSKNLQSDMWRFYQLDKSTSSREHSFWRFGTGNKETLWDEPLARGVDVRARLIEWQEKHYSANLMKLVVLGKDSLDELTKVVVEKFSPSPNRHLPVPHYEGSPLTENELRKTILVKSVKDHRSLELTFPFPYEGPFYATKPGSFLSHMIGHEGQGSILSLLKNKGWANSVSAGAGNGAFGFEFFKVHIDLTKEGLEHHEDVAAVVFKYIDLLKATPPQEWAFNEVNKLSQIGFRFKEKSPPTGTSMQLSLQMCKPYPRDLLLSAPWLSTKWSPEVIRKTSEYLGADRCRIMIGSQEAIGDKEYAEREKWYGTEYTIVPMSERLLNGSKEGDFPELALPKPNTFIPTNLEILNKVELTEFAKRPLSLRNSPTSRLWYKKDDRWWVPRAGAFFLMRSPLIDDTPFHAVQSRFFTELIRDSLVEYSYDAELAGLSYNFDSQGDGILLTLDGYNDKLAVLAKVVFDKMRTLKVDPKRFEIILDQLRRSFVNYRLEQPYQHAAFGVQHLTAETQWTQEERLAELDNLTVENLQAYIDTLFARMHIETLVHGNVLKDDALVLAKLAESTFSPSPLTPTELLSHRSLIISEGKHLLRQDVGNPENVNSAVEQFTYCGDLTDEAVRTRLSVLSAMVQEPLFDDLRAKQQLGYIVSSGTRKSIGSTGLRVIVQSEKDAAFVEGRIDVFWEEYKTVLDKMSEEEFDKYKTTVVNKKLEDHKNMYQESSHLWINIHSGYYDFLQKERDAVLIAALTKQDIVDFFTTYFFDTPSHPIRRLSVHLRSHRLQPEALASLGPAFAALNVPVDPAAFGALAASKPTIPVVKMFVQDFLKGHGKSEEKIETYLEKVEALGKPEVPEGVRLIRDAMAWKKEQVPGPRSFPAAEYSDLFPSKM